MNDFAISPDGGAIVFTAVTGGTHSLFLRRLDTFEIRNVEGSEGAIAPFWSSDGEWIGFTARGRLWKTKTAGGPPPEAICEVASAGARASWQGNTILFADWGDRKEIMSVPAGGGNPVKVTSLRPREWRHSWPSLLSDGRHFLYLSFAYESLERKLIFASLAGPEQTVLATNVSQAHLLGQDRVAYVRDGKLLSQRFDVDDGTIIGEPTTIAGDVDYFYPTARADFDTSPAGVLAYRTDTSTGRLVQMDRKGNETRVVDDKELFYDDALSPDGKKAAVTVETRSTGLMDIWIYDLARGVRDRFTSEPAIEVSPTWSPDGRSIVYSQGEGGVFPHLVMRPLGSSRSEELMPRGPFQFGAAFSPDGETLFYEHSAAEGNDIYRLSMKTKRSEPFLETNFSEDEPAVSPDGHWLAFSSNASGAREVYVQNLASGSARIRISNRGGLRPRWRGDGKELFYLSPDRSVNSVVPTAPDRWDDATLTELFRSSRRIRGFAVAPDGQSFLISQWTVGDSDDLFHVILGVP